jgi:hypothetical protein
MPLPSGIRVRQRSTPREAFEPSFSLKGADRLLNYWRRRSPSPGLGASSYYAKTPGREMKAISVILIHTPRRKLIYQKINALRR